MMPVGRKSADVLSGARSWAVLTGDCVTLDLPAASVDAVVTDPPAGISFMGKGWDHHKGGRAAWVAWMTERMRVAFCLLKPGGHAVVWALPRTSHWTATAVEDAGFEVRDVLTHHFGSGFPKSLDVSKAIDSAAGAVRDRVPHDGGLASESNNLVGAGPNIGTRQTDEPATPEAAQWQGWGTALKPAVERWVLARKPIALLGEVVSLAQCLSLSLVRIAADLSRSSHGAVEPDSALPSAAPPSATPGASCEVTATSSCATASDTPLSTVSSWLAILADVSALASTFTTETASRTTTDLKILNCLASKITQESTPPDASSQSGWTAFAESAAPSFDSLRASCNETRACTAGGSAGESLSPRWGSASQAEENEEPTGPGSEDWILARKPLIGTVAQNVLAHGTGGINVDACRVAHVTVNGGNLADNPHLRDDYKQSGGRMFICEQATTFAAAPLGRWPTNLLLSHGEGCNGVCATDCPVAELDRQSGSGASRFYPTFRYVPKAPRAMREEGLHDAAKRVASVGNTDDSGRDPVNPKNYHGNQRTRVEAGLPATEPRANDHPTVKHDDLMCWLCRLVTPPGGVVLDLFCGSGSTGRGALKEGFRFIGIDDEAHYVEIAEQRIAAVVPAPVEPEKQTTIFDLLARAS